MTDKIFKMESGKITFSEEKVLISDQPRWYGWLHIFTAAIWAFYGITSILRYIKSNDEFDLWVGIFVITVNVALLVFYLFMSYKNEINQHEISSIKVKERFGNRFLDIKLKSGKIRRVFQIGNIADELKHFLENETTYQFK